MSAIRPYGPPSTPLDSREKLEADVRDYFSHWIGGTSRTQEAIKSWLDRQAAITERHWMEICGANANANVELKRQIDDLTADAKKMGDQLYDMENQRDVLQAKLDIAQEISDGLRSSLDEVIAERNQLAEERDELVRKSKEFEQTHMELPVDANGVPIRCGDAMTVGGGEVHVGAVGIGGFNSAPLFCSCDARHVQQDAVESLLTEFAERIRKAVGR